MFNDVTAKIINLDAIQNPTPFNGRGQVVAVADTGLDTGHNDHSMCKDFQGRIVRMFSLGRPGDTSDTEGHGTHVAGSILGDGSNSNGIIKGMAPAAKLVFQSTMDSDRNLGGIPDDLRVGLFDVAKSSGAKIHNNSWGQQKGNGIYNGNCSQADDFAFKNRDFLICFAAGNDGDDPNFPLVSPPGSAKNVLTVGASKSERQLPQNIAGLGDNKNEVAPYSCRGPVQNNRRKPDIVAPGTYVLSVRSSVCLETGSDGSLSHAAAIGYGLPGRPEFGTGPENTPPLPPGVPDSSIELYMYDGGTSMATPITSGACTVVRQYLVEKRGYENPSAALIKAMMVNGAIDMGLGAPDKTQGWGRIDLKNTVKPDSSDKMQIDDNLNNAVATGVIRTYNPSVSSTSSPLTVTLVWRDPEGDAIQNKLHLRVIENGSGNVFNSDNINNIQNNVQKVIISNPNAAGGYHIEIEGINITQGIDELLPEIRQDYALAVNNANSLSLSQ